MRGPGREEKTLAQLIRIAQAQADDLRSQLANLEAGKTSAEASLDWLAQAVRAEENAGERQSTAVVDFARFLEGAAAKRQALEATRDTLAAEIVSVREALQTAFGELKKLEHLIDVNRRATAKRGQKDEADAAADIAVIRRPRSGAA